MASTDKIAAAMASGLSAVCATCTRYWDARDRGVPGSQCTSSSGCRGPVGGGAFHDYRGPLAGVLHLWCFVCASKSDYGLRGSADSATIGVCAKHLDLVKQHQPVADIPAPPVAVIPSKVDVSPPKAKKTLLDAMLETEAEWDDDRRR